MSWHCSYNKYCSPMLPCIHHRATLKEKPSRPVFGVQISADFGKTWKVKALCNDCFKTIEPPEMAKKGIEAGAFTCDWCGCRNEIFVGKRYGKSKNSEKR